MNRNNNLGNNRNNSLIDIFGLFVDFYSVFLGEENLKLNNEQVQQLDTHLQKQDNEFLAKIISQNEFLIEQNKEIIKLLKQR